MTENWQRVTVEQFYGDGTKQPFRAVYRVMWDDALVAQFVGGSGEKLTPVLASQFAIECRDSVLRFLDSIK